MAEPPPENWSRPFAAGAIGAEQSVLSRLRAASHAMPDAIDFGVSNPAAATIPVAALTQATEAALSDSHNLFRYQSPAGSVRLREAIVSAYPMPNVTPDSILVADGAQHAFFLISAVLIDPGDTVLCEEATYPGMFHNPLLMRGQITTVPNAGGRLDLEGLEELLASLASDSIRPKLLMVQPICHNPWGYSLDRADVERLVLLAHRFRFTIVEDCAYLFLKPDALCLFQAEQEMGLGDAGRVVHINTFSKTLSPGLRKAFIVADRPLLARMRNCRQITSKHPPGLTDTICALLIEQDSAAGFDFNGWLESLRDHYGRKLRLAVSCLQKPELSPHLVLEFVPPCGLFAYPRVNIREPSEFVWHALEHGVVVAPDVTFTPCVPKPRDARHVRISITSPPVAHVAEGVARLARALETWV